MQNFKTYAAKSCKLLLFGGLALMQLKAAAQTYTVSTLQNTGAKSNRVNFVFVSDGYTSAELPTFATNATTVKNALLAVTPLAQYTSFINVYAVQVPSTQSGTKHPGTASDESTSGGQPVTNPTTYFSSTFDYSGTHRLVYQSSQTPITNVLAANLPEYTQGIVLCNTTYYGGAGGTYATSTLHTSATEIAIHEIGHSFAGLADEYWAGTGYAAEKPNMTQTSSSSTIKWKSWLGINSIGIYAYGTTSPESAWYRPHQSCRMQYLGYAFCSVCSEAFISKIHSKVNMIDAYTPTSTSFTLSGTGNQTFTVTNLQTTNNSISVKWYLNSSSVPFATGTTATVPYNSFATGTNTVKAIATDSTGLSKSYLPAAGYTRTVTWTITKSTAVIKLSGTVSQNANQLQWREDSSGVTADHYILEKSDDGKNFYQVATLPATSHTTTDRQLNGTEAFYRISAADASGRIQSNATILMRNPLTKFNYKVYQDAIGRRYKFTYEGDIASDARGELTVVNSAGMVVLKRNLGKVSKSTNYDFNLTGQPAGIYFAQIMINNQVYSAELLAQ
ncbi:M64 family metallopeptidase [Chitinophaga sp. 30R24]|uniref:M64 family metallopeptidase n=1 Tax=Chitinophaga sp. 30R24 TaxID=3248838 RepID=UPI003B91D364